MPFLEDLMMGFTDISQGLKPGAGVKLPLPAPSRSPVQLAGHGIPLVDDDLTRQAEALRTLQWIQQNPVPYVTEPTMPPHLQRNIDETQLEAERQIGHALNQQNVHDLRESMRAERLAREFARREAEMAKGRAPEFRDPDLKGQPQPSNRRR